MKKQQNMTEGTTEILESSSKKSICMGVCLQVHYVPTSNQYGLNANSIELDLQWKNALRVKGCVFK